MTQPTVTQAERDYVAGMERRTASLYHYVEEYEQGDADKAVRAIIDYIRNNPLPEQGK